jgi:PIN domain nuclease of toxin-antitoxin system
LTPQLLLDTYAVLRILTDEGISEDARQLINKAASEGRVLVSPFSAWEVAVLVRRGRVALSMAPDAWFEMVLRHPGIALAPMPPATLVASAFLPGDPPSDPADCIIIATARAENLTVVTRDAKILAYAKTGHVLAMAC